MRYAFSIETLKKARMDSVESEDSFRDRLCANMNDLITSFWNSMMKEGGMESWLVGDFHLTFSPSSTDMLISAPEVESDDKNSDSPSEKENDSDAPEDSQSSRNPHPELHSIDSFTDNEEFDRIFADAAALNSPESEHQADDTDVVVVDSSSGDEELMDDEADNEDISCECGDGSRGMSGSPHASGSKRRCDVVEDSCRLGAKQPRMMPSSLAGRPMVTMNCVGMD